MYELKFWQVRRIIKGYRKRGHLTHQLLAECAYAAMYVMRSPEGKTVKDIFPSLFKDDDEDYTPISDADKQELQELMQNTMI